MENLTREDLKHFEGKTLRLITMNDGLLRNRNSAFFAAVSDEEAMAFCETVKNELPAGDYNFSTVGFELPDISYFSLLFDNNYPGFQLVNYGFFASADLLYEKRPEVVKKIEHIYENDGVLFVALLNNGNAIGKSVGNTHVTVSFFTNEAEAEKYAEAGTGAHTLERWITNPPLDVTVFSIDGEVVYGWEIFEATHNVWSQYVIEEDKLHQLIDGNKLHILAADDGSGAIMRCQGFPILFLTDDSLKEFAEANREEMTHEFFDMSVENGDGIKIVTGMSQYAFIDSDEGRYVCKCNDLLKLMA